MGTVFLVVLIDLMGFGIVLPLLPFYASKFNASAVSIGLLYSIYSLAQLVFSPVWGSFSDRIGRRPIMLVSTFGAVLAYILFSFSSSFGLLFFSRFLAGVMGGNISTAQAYIADITSHKDRAKGMGMIGAAFGIGFTLGPALATLLIHPRFHSLSENPYVLPGLFAAGLSAVSFLLVLFKLPETVRKSQAGGDSMRMTKSSIFTQSFWQGIRRQNQASQHHILPILLFSMFLLSFGQSSLYSAFPLFCKTIFSLSPQQVGMKFVYMGLIAIFIQGGLIRPLEKRFGEKKLFFVGSILMVLGLGAMPFAPTEGLLTFFLCIMSVGASLNGPTLSSLISKEADPAMVGSMMGTSQGFAALGRVIGPTWGGLLFGIASHSPFVVTALFLSLTIFFGIQLAKN